MTKKEALKLWEAAFDREVRRKCISKWTDQVFNIFPNLHPNELCAIKVLLKHNYFKEPGRIAVLQYITSTTPLGKMLYDQR